MGDDIISMSVQCIRLFRSYRYWYEFQPYPPTGLSDRVFHIYGPRWVGSRPSALPVMCNAKTDLCQPEQHPYWPIYTRRLRRQVRDYAPHASCIYNSG